MSWYNSVVLSFACDEFEEKGDETIETCQALRTINRWLKRHEYPPLENMNPQARGLLGSNAVLFGGCYNKLDVDAWVEVVAEQSWKSVADVQILLWDDNASAFEVIRLEAARA
jgi:hypothetical protein